MSSHVHLIIGTTGERMEDILRDLKRHTSKALLKAISENPQEIRREWMLWMFGRANEIRTMTNFSSGNSIIILLNSTNNDVMQQKLDYLHSNPVEAGFVNEPWEYLYSSAKDL